MAVVQPIVLVMVQMADRVAVLLTLGLLARVLQVKEMLEVADIQI